MLVDVPNLPARRSELVFSSPGANGQCVVKDSRNGAYFNLGEQESFLLRGLDGKQTATSLCAAFESRFGQPLSEAELGEFLGLVQAWGFLQSGQESKTAEAAPGSAPDHPQSRPRAGVNLLAWRVRLFDPDHLFNWLEPRLRFVWTGTFVVLSSILILGAAVVVCANRHDLVSPFAHALKWETLALIGATLLVTLICHEFAHGLTCKHYGGEVHEVGFLMLFLMPCLYCNVSDAWLIPEKSKRFWVTLAGCCCDLGLSSMAVFVWRLTIPGSLPNQLAWVVLIVCGGRLLLNLNPLLKLDGYYLLCDLVEIPNLRQRSVERLMAHLRWLLWGARRPSREARGRFLISYGIICWLFSLVFLGLMLLALARSFGSRWGSVGIGGVTLLGSMVMRNQFQGLFAGEVGRMILLRRRRTTVWVLLLAILPVVLALGQMEDWSSGTFQVRPVTRVEVRAQVAGFLQAVYLDQGDRVSSGVVVARLEVPDLASRITQKRAEAREARAVLRRLMAGTRPNEIVDQRRRISRAKAWCDKGERDLERTRKTFNEDVTRFDAQIAKYRAEYDTAVVAFNRAKKLLGRGALAAEELWEADRKCRVFWAQLQEAEAQKRARQAEGTREAEAELSRREQALAEAEATLVLLEAGTRPEEVDEARAKVARLEEEAAYLEGLREKLLVTSPVPGLIVTPRLREKVGQYLREGELICEVKGSSVLEAEIALSEQDVARVRPGQKIALKPRALPSLTLYTHVDRIAPSAWSYEPQVANGVPASPGGMPPAPGIAPTSPSNVIVYCRIEDPATELRPGMTGYARITCDRRSLGEILGERIKGVVRTEFWW